MAVEKTSGKIQYSNTDKYIRWANISSLMESMLNMAAGRAMFKVYADNKTEPTDNEPYVCVLKMRIEPSTMRGTGSSTIDIRLTVKIPTENAEIKNRAVNVLNKILGAMSGTFNVTEYGETMEYTFFSNFRIGDSQTPENINAQFVASYVIEGKMSVMRSTGGAVLSDMVKTYISMPANLIGITAGNHEILTRSVQGSWQTITDNPVKMGDMQAETEYTAISSTKSLIILQRNDEISNFLLDFINGRISPGLNPFIDDETGKYVVTLKEVYPFKAIEKKYYLTGITNSREAGAYASFVLSLNVIPPQIYTFYIGMSPQQAGTYSFKENMTWGGWVESEYNTDGYKIENGKVYTATGLVVQTFNTIDEPSSEDVLPNDQINKNAFYIVSIPI